MSRPWVIRFTFLATLFLLLAISSAIIMRGIFLRRRFRRRLEEALAAGVLLSPTEDGSGGFGRGGGRRKLKRPTLFDVSVLPPYFSTADPLDGKWERIMPVSASVSSEKPGLDPLPSNESTHSVDPPPRGHLTAGMLLERAGFIIPRARLRRARPAPPQPPSSGDAPPSPSIPLEQRDPVLRAAEVQVAVVIAMPNPHRSAYLSPAAAAREAAAATGVHLDGTGKGKARGSGAWDDGEEEGVPDVVLGSAKVTLCGADGNERELP
ncbi:hypothetical protein BV20DRAFT_99334 [Pilatotrama ljubarskyi]|nr:hypothetical protein BV20DRAFT_99334 [Pilatotrama ljubarskyi]